MPCGILLCGLNGSGKSTLNHALAKATGYAELDAEDYYFPDQKDSRIAAIQTENVPYVTGKDKLPFSVPLSKAEVQRALLRDIENNPAFILSGVKADWNDAILAHVAVVFYLRTPTEIRAERIVVREVRRFGSRVLPGGDMYEGQEQFRRFAAGREESVVTDSFGGLRCPVIELDGTKTVEENVGIVKESLRNILPDSFA